MDSLDGTSWDVTIAGTGIQQSLLALSLSRTNLKILHLDRNDYYGGDEAALSLQEADAWVKRVNDETGPASKFSDASIDEPPSHHGSSGGNKSTKLSFSRAYSLALAPQAIYARSDLLPKLVSSKVYRQLEFLAVGSWFTVGNSSINTDGRAEEEHTDTPTLQRIPSSREDVFTDASLDLNGRRRLMKFLRFIADFEQQDGQDWQDPKSELDIFPAFLERKFGIPRHLQDPIIALTSSPATPNENLTIDALRKIQHHLRSIGVFGRGFGSVISKWGGLSEIVQVGCRAAAVGGATYVLDKAITSCKQQADSTIEVQLQGGEKVTTKWLVGCNDDLVGLKDDTSTKADQSTWYHTVSIIDSPLPSLFPATAEGSPAPAGAIVYLPPSQPHHQDVEDLQASMPVYLHVHSSDTGECPNGQSVIYASLPVSISGPNHSNGTDARGKLDVAVSRVLQASGTSPGAAVIWRLGYTQRHEPASAKVREQGPTVIFPDAATGVSFDDSIIERVRQVWSKVTGTETKNDEFMLFEDREDYGDMGDDFDDS